MRIRRNRGFSLIEGLVAMVVLSIGMLGMAALYTTGFKTSRSAVLRNKGVLFATDIAARIRANPVAEADYVVDEEGTGADKGCSDHYSGSGVAEAVYCDAATMAVHDIYQWKQAIEDSRAGLPNGTGKVERDATTTPATWSVTVAWTEEDEELSYVLTFQL